MLSICSENLDLTIEREQFYGVEVIMTVYTENKCNFILCGIVFCEKKIEILVSPENKVHTKMPLKHNFNTFKTRMSMYPFNLDIIIKHFFRTGCC